jgi:hypothetical protein
LRAGCACQQEMSISGSHGSSRSRYIVHLPAYRLIIVLWLSGFGAVLVATVVLCGMCVQTLGSMHQGGCIKAVPAQLALGVVNTWYASTIAWRLGSNSSSRGPTASLSSSRDVGLGRVGRASGPTAAWTAAGPSGAQEVLGMPVAAGVAGGAAAVQGSPPPSRLPDVVDTAVLSPRNTGAASLRSRAAQQSSGL